MMQTKFFIFNAFQQRCILVWDEQGNCAVIDPGFYNAKEKNELFDFIKTKGLKPICIMMTHMHFDHIFGMYETALEFGIPVYMNAEDKVIMEQANGPLCQTYGLKEPFLGNEDKKPDYTYINGGDIINVGSLSFEVIHTPGHTPGGVCFLERNEKFLVSGDTLFAGAIGRTDNQWGDYDKLIDGIQTKLMVLDGDIEVIPGHGPVTSIGKEGMTNPFLLPFNLPYDEE